MHHMYIHALTDTYTRSMTYMNAPRLLGFTGVKGRADGQFQVMAGKLWWVYNGGSVMAGEKWRVYNGGNVMAGV
jgi:hypothetical protein